MIPYLLVKWLHILSSVLLVGTGFGSAFYMFFANRSGNLAAQVVVTRLVVRADWWFTTPAGIVQPVSGLYLMYLTGWSLTWDTPWILASLILYAIAGLCWLPVVWLQIRMSQMAELALQEGTELPEKYFRYARRWELLGYPAFIAMLGIYFLMVNKPMLWG
ncbi:hypothetical protein CO608_08415 [Lysobacteraceae bacterium NML08-0793]|nr:hypothetical protein CO608_08415 [Xanthomonadaceae bacterium NML08-0793]